MNVLLCLDDCREAQEEALRLVREQGAALTALFVLDATWNVYVGHDWLSGSDSRADFLEWIRDEEVKAAEAAFADFRTLAAGVPVTEKTAAGNVQEEILAEARQGYDLVIMGNPFSRGLEVVRKAVPAMAESCPCNLLLIRRKR